MYIMQSSVRQRLGTFEGTFGQVLPTTNFKVSSGYTLKQSGNTYYLLNSKGQQTSSNYTIDQIKQNGGIKDYQGKVGLSYVPTATASTPTSTSFLNLNLTGSCALSKAGTCDISGQCYDTKGCPISDEEAARVYSASTPSTSPSPPISTGASAGEVLTGVGSILSALATPAAGIFQTYTESKLAKAALKREQQQMPSYVPTMQPQVIQQGPSTGLILGLVGGFAAIALILVLVLKK